MPQRNEKYGIVCSSDDKPDIPNTIILPASFTLNQLLEAIKNEFPQTQFRELEIL